MSKKISYLIAALLFTVAITFRSNPLLVALLHGKLDYYLRGRTVTTGWGDLITPVSQGLLFLVAILFTVLTFSYFSSQGQLQPGVKSRKRIHPLIVLFLTAIFSVLGLWGFLHLLVILA